MPVYFVITLVLFALAQISAKKSFRSISIVREVLNSNSLMVKQSASKPKTVKFSVYQVYNLHPMFYFKTNPAFFFFTNHGSITSKQII